MPNRLDFTTRQLFPSSDAWIVPWMGLWWAWALCVLFQFELRDKMSIARPLLLFIIIGSLTTLIAIRDAHAARRFAIAYLLTSAYGLYAALRFIEVPLSYLLSDPGLSSISYRNLGIREYNYFSHHLSIAFLLGIGLFLQARRLWSMALILALALWCGYGVFLTGARQSLSGAGVAAALIFGWALSRAGKKLRRVPLAMAAIVIVVVLLYQVAPHLVVREGESGLEVSFNVFEDRGGLWQIGWDYFLASPVWGWGFEYKLWSHNVLIGTLADQGLIGMVFFLGYLIWAVRRLPAVWAQTPADDRAVWRVVFFALFVFVMVQYNGNRPLALAALGCLGTERRCSDSASPATVASAAAGAHGSSRCSAMKAIPRITFGMIVLNGEPFLGYNLRAIYPFAHQIIVAEGASPRAAHAATPDGHSIDGTLQTLHRSKAEEDPDNKLIIGTGRAGEGRLIRYPDRLNRFWLYRKMICQQVWFVRRAIYAAQPFATDYRILADYAYLLDMILRRQVCYVHLAKEVAIFDGGGISTKTSPRRDAERARALATVYSPWELRLYEAIFGGMRWLNRTLIYPVVPPLPERLRARLSGL